MRITAVEEYGLRCLLALASKGRGEQLSIAEIAEMEGLSVPYVSKLLSILRKAGLVSAERGRSGGFSITRPLKEITLYEVMTSLGGPLIDPEHCRRHSGLRKECIHLNKCSVHDVLGGLAGYLQAFLTRTTLEDLTQRDVPSVLERHAGGVFISDEALRQELKRVSSRKSQSTVTNKEA
jgi:Rrf2 family iron-sulfur cluster assembly transcriptional regulator